MRFAITVTLVIGTIIVPLLVMMAIIGGTDYRPPAAPGPIGTLCRCGIRGDHNTQGAGHGPT